MSKRYERAKYLTKKYQDKLLPCKYCGEKPVFVIDRGFIPTKSGYSYGVVFPTPACDSCNAKTIKEAIKKWKDVHLKPNRNKRERHKIFETKCSELEIAKIEAYKEFAERLCDGKVSNDKTVIEVKVLLKEMVGDNDGNT